MAKSNLIIKPKGRNDTALYLTLLAGGIIRLLLSLTRLPELLAVRNELTTPITSWKRFILQKIADSGGGTSCTLVTGIILIGFFLIVLEGFHLSKSLLQNPYIGGSFHHPPLLLLLPLAKPILCHFIWTLTEVGTAYFLSRIANGRKRDLLDGEGEEIWSGWRIAALYLVHPFSLGTTLARSTIVFSNFFVALAISSAMSGSIFPAVFSLSLATHLSFYPALLLPPIVTILYRSSATSQSKSTVIVAIIAYSLHQSLVLLLSNWLTGSWDFLFSVYGVILTIPDLTPTIGLGWYFFIEMFDHFRAFFVGVFQLHILAYVAPLTIAYNHDPLFTIVLLVGIIGIFKTYPSLGDFSLWHALLATYSELGSHISRPLLLFSLSLYSIALLPTFHYLWLYSGSGNANFFYASTLVWAISQGGLLVDILKAKERRDVLRAIGIDGRSKVKEGIWVVIQK